MESIKQQLIKDIESFNNAVFIDCIERGGREELHFQATQFAATGIKRLVEESYENINAGLGHYRDTNKYYIQLKTNIYEMPYRKAMAACGMDEWEMAFADSVPAACTEGCMVEPDGKCEHGNIAVTQILMCL